MRSTTLVLAIAVGLGLPATGSIAASAALAADRVDGKPGSYIVLFDDAPLALYRGSNGKTGPTQRLAATSPLATGARKLDVNSVEARAYRGYLRDARNGWLNQAAVVLGRPLAPTHVYDVATNGIALMLTPDEARRLAELPGVRSVHPDFVRKPLTDRGPRWIKADQIWSGLATGGLQKRGEGIVVGVIDTGINAAHDSFKATGPADGYTVVNPRGKYYGLCATDATPCNSKLIGIWDMTTTGSDGETNNGFDNYSTDPSGVAGAYGNCRATTNDPDECVGHGSHTASTAAGDAVNITLVAAGFSKSTQMSGVAPHANLITYKACEAVASCQGTWLLAAIDQAVADQVDVINFSIGGPPSDPFAALGTSAIDDDAEAFLAARAAGVTVAAAAGNDGPDPGTHGNPANAPWLLGVAAATHDRAVVNRLTGMTGGDTPPPGGGTLVGAGDLSAPTSTALLPIVAANDYPLCGAGSNPDGDPPTGVSKPPTWTASTWTGKIVVCTRGFYARVAKSNNVRLGGGAGMVLANSAAEGESVVNDNHSIPSTHVNYANGQALLAWLATGTGHKAKLEGTTIGTDASVADHLADFSGRGPVVPLGVIKPDLTAPGVEIVAASNSVSSCAGSPTTCYNYLSGTSMATPHVAGAAALLKSVHPDWTPSRLISALMLTARASVKVSDGTIGTPHDQGAGMIDVSRATNAGLYLEATDAQFRAADALTARDLNLPSLAHDDCIVTCSLTRTFTDMIGGGNWSISSTMPAGASITPSVAAFSIGANASKAVTFTFDIDDASLYGKWVYGSVTLTDTSGNQRPSLTLPVAVYASPGNVPTQLSANVNLERGYFDTTLSGIVGLPDARFDAHQLAPVKQAAPKIKQDPTRDDAFDSLSQVYRDTLTLPAAGAALPDRYRIHVSTSSAVAPDVDLYVGKDLNGDGLPSADEVVCSSRGPDANESCELDVAPGASAGNYWLVVQNYRGSSPVTLNQIDVETYVAPLSSGTDTSGRVPSMVATGDGHTEFGADIHLRVGWDDPSFLNGQVRVGFIDMSSTQGNRIATIPVRLQRVAGGFAPYALANGVGRAVTLPAGAAHDKLFFDVPPSAGAVKFTTSGTGSVKLDLYRINVPAGPTISAAPTGTPNATANASGANQTIQLSGAALSPGRWYVKPTNTGTGDASVTVTATIVPSSVTPLGVLPGSYYNPARGGHGVFVYPAADQWQLIWYTYFQDGTPTWYFVQALKPGSDGTWNGVLYRSAWNGTANHLTVVGNLLITPTSTNTFTMAYSIDGETGAEPMSAFITGCPVSGATTFDNSAHWYTPGHDGFGYSVQLNPNYEFVADFVYDSVGRPRFLVAERLGAFDPANTSLTLEQLTGFCPLCTAVTPTRTAIGTLSRTYSGGTLATLGSTATYTGSVPGTWTADYPVTKLGLTQGCATP